MLLDVYMMGNVRKCQIYLIKSKTLIWRSLDVFTESERVLIVCVGSNFQIDQRARTEEQLLTRN